MNASTAICKSVAHVCVECVRMNERELLKIQI